MLPKLGVVIDADLARFVYVRKEILTEVQKNELSHENRELLKRVKPKLEQYLAEIYKIEGILTKSRKSDDKWDF